MREPSADRENRRTLHRSCSTRTDGFDVLGKVKMIMATTGQTPATPHSGPSRLDRKIEIRCPPTKQARQDGGPRSYTSGQSPSTRRSTTRPSSSF